jgi:hypothetical protein
MQPRRAGRQPQTWVALRSPGFGADGTAAGGSGAAGADSGAACVAVAG